jgi:tetratricopeptide (TPR) repeat protein
MGNYVAIDASPGQNPYEIVYHEYIHYYLDNNTPSPLPTWFNEGIAEYYSTFTVTVDESRVEIGRPVAAHAIYLSTQPIMPLEEVLAVTTDSPVYNETDKQGPFYATSWALVHYLYSGERATQLQGFLKMFGEGRPIDEAFEAAFHTTYADLQKELKGYIRRNSYPFTRYTFRELSIDEEVAVATLERPEALFRLGDYLAHQGSRRAPEAQEHFHAVLELEPGHPGALAGRGYLLDMVGRYDEAGELYAASLERDPDNFSTRHLAGLNLVNQFTEQSQGNAGTFDELPPLLARAREQFRRAVELNPGLASAYAGFGYTYIADPGDVSPGIRALEKARSLMPRRTDFAFNLFLLYLQQGDRRKAEAIERVLLRDADPEIAGRAREALLQDELRAAESLLADGRLEEAVELLRRVRDETDDDRLRARLDAYLTEIATVLDLERASDLYRTGRLAEAESLLVSLLDRLGDPGQRDYAEQLLEEIREVRSRSRP